MGALSRRPESNSLAEPLSRYRTIEFLNQPATLDGGDVLRIGRRVWVGLSKRTNQEGVNQLGEILRPRGYVVKSVEMKNILHLKSACSCISDNALLINRSFVESEPFRNLKLIEVPDDEPAAANVLSVNGVVIVPASFPKTQALIRERGYKVETIDVSELQKAEAGVTCCSLIFPAVP
jgi:dimethylargininase